MCDRNSLYCTSNLFLRLGSKDLINSIFTSALAIKWSGVSPEFEAELKTPVNLFRILFSYLSDNKAYLKYLQDDKSYAIINNNAPVGVYEYINEKGEVVFNKYGK